MKKILENVSVMVLGSALFHDVTIHWFSVFQSSPDSDLFPTFFFLLLVGKLVLCHGAHLQDFHLWLP